MAKLPVASAEEAGFDASRLKRIDSLLRDWTSGDSPVWPSAALVFGRHGRMVAPKYYGRMGPEPDAPPVRRDAVWLIASLTKPITYLGALLLVERGLLGLSDRVARYLPEFATHGKDSTLVQHLFTHTSGLPDMLPDNRELRRARAPLAEFARRAIEETRPLFPPGTDFNYQSMGTLVVAELVRRLTGRPIDQFLRDEFFEPLGLSSTRLGADGIDRSRIVRLRTPAEQEPEWDWNSEYWRLLGAPWGGMFSSPEEYAVFCQMMLADGRIGDRQYVSPATVRMATGNRLDDLPGLPEPVRRCKAWGLGWQLNHPAGADSLCDLLDASAFGHLGATGTMAWADRRTDSFCVLFTSAPRDDAPWRLVQVTTAVAAALLELRT